MSNSFAIPWTVARQAPLSMGFPRQEYWSGLPFPSPGNLPTPGIEAMAPASPALPTNSLPLSYLGNPSRTQVNQTQPSSNDAFQGESHSAISSGGPGSHLFLFKDHTCDSVTHYTCSPPSSWWQGCSFSILCFSFPLQNLLPVLTSRSYSHLLGDSSFNRASCWRWILPLYLDTELHLEDRILGEGGASGKEPACQCKRHGFNHWITPSPVGGNGNPLQCSCLENPTNRGAWQVIVHGVTESHMTECLNTKKE